MGNFISKNLSLLLTIGGLYYVYKYIDSGSKSFTEPLGNLLAKLQFKANGSHDIEREWPGFFLDRSKLDFSYKVKDELWLEAIIKLNPQNQALVDTIFDADMRLRPEYEVLLNGEVSPQTIETVQAR
ncbi:hypothetical protein [Pseudoalteromonas sp. Of11M-6]|uniref:hypothetical protein n=1 Tax=Pseudoalteromonas sp. Of11M-6 TaxID=2917754 RepID=UPI001EF74FAF|nr:hypothetical protein [Pseudoalteromonas sp. Of11M-6]MCG7551953.1 hypothetical protein [Pseudoalteromonas sp. Of11M-6]